MIEETKTDSPQEDKIMMRSLYSGVSGLKTHQIKMDVIGNNIANVNTLAFKSSSVTFSEIMYQTTQNASGANALTGTGGINAKQIGLGVSLGSTTTNIAAAGATQTTGGALDVKIKGDNFFVVNNGSTNMFTRAGSFYFDGTGNLAMTSTGYNVMGWQIDGNTGEIKKDTVSALRIMQASNLTSPPEATLNAVATGILDSNAKAVTTEDGYIMNLNFFDSLGYQYTGKYKVTEGAIKDTYNVSLSDVLDSKGKTIIDTIGTENLFGVAYPGQQDQGTLLSGYKMLNNPITDGSGTTATHYYLQNSEGNLMDDSNFYVGADGKYMALDTATNTLIPLSDVNPLNQTAINKETANIHGLYQKYFSGISADIKITGNSTFADVTKWNQVLSISGEILTVASGKTLVQDNTTAPIIHYSFNDTAGAPILGTDFYVNATNQFCTSAGAPLTDPEHSTVDSFLRTNTTGWSPTFATKNTTCTYDTVIDGNSKIDMTGTKYYQVLTFNGDDGSFDNIGGANAVTVAMANLGGNFKNIGIDFSQVTMFNNGGTSTMGMDKGAVDGKTGTGKKLGALTGVSIDTNGMIYGSYDNGNTVLLAQIAVANFANASGLEKVGENCYGTTLNSGEFDGIGVDITADGGGMSTGALEMSNVDLSNEFTEMITTQRGFQANSRIITTSDTLLEELINLKR